MLINFKKMDDIKDALTKYILLVGCLTVLLFSVPYTCNAGSWQRMSISEMSGDEVPDYLKRFNERIQKKEIKINAQIKSLSKTDVSEPKEGSYIYLAKLSDPGESTLCIRVENDLIATISLATPLNNHAEAVGFLTLILADSGMSETGFKNFYKNMAQSVKENNAPKILDKQGNVKLQIEAGIPEKNILFMTVSCWKYQ